MLQNHDGTPGSTPVWNPPPHLEARFSRKRRRGTHSPCTQPLTASSLATTRRQLLLDSRKSLLRQRAAHVEKVRRARANSHEAVGERLLALQQSLSQAQDSRNAILAKIAGSCANEVAKAKRLAQETRVRREEEARALKSGVDERMLEAERRRMVMLRERRGKRRERGSENRGKVDGCSDVEEEEEDTSAALGRIRLGGKKEEEECREEAARCIQKVYRNYINREIVKRFLGLGLTIESVRDTSFEDISNLFQEEKAQKATARLLRHCGLLAAPATDAEVDVEVACRTFLSAYLILGHPAEVLSNDGDNEKALITKSKDLLIAFESFLSSPTFPPAQHLAETWDSFSTAFTSWKARDSEILINTMVAQYAELDLIWQKVKDDSDEYVAADFKEGIRENQLMLLVRIRRFAGEKTRVLIRQAVKEARRTRLPKKEKADTRPRETPSSTDSNSVSTAVNSPVSTPPPQPATSSAPHTQTDAAAAADVFSHLTDTGMLSNRQLVHELALDRDFKLTPRPKNTLHSLVTREAHRAFWDTMRTDILTHNNLTKWIPSLATTIKTKLLHLLDPSGSLHRLISDSIDPVIITQQCDTGSYDYEALFTFVLRILPQICSPARDSDVQALIADTGDYIARLQRLFDVLELLQLDHANFLLMMSAQYVIPEAIPYERRLFTSDLASSRTSLTHTTTWLQNAASSLPPTSTATQIYNHAFISLTLTLTLPPSPLPETLHLDVDRIASFQAKYRSIVLGAAITLTTKNLLRRDIRTSFPALKERVCYLLTSTPRPSPSSIAASITSLLTETSTTPPSTLSGVSAAVVRILERTEQDAVVRVVGKRVRGFVEERVGAVGSREMVRLATGGGEVLAGWGMAEWVGEAVGLGEGVGKVAAWNRGCYGGWYNGILGIGIGGTGA